MPILIVIKIPVPTNEIVLSGGCISQILSVEKHISHLLFERDCVIIPHFGGFVGNYKSAKFDKLQNKFTPPSKEISFNKNLTHNDGLLANRISSEEKKSFEEANAFLKKYAEDLKRVLRQGKKIEFDQIGILFTDEHQNLQFEPDYSTNYLIDSFGLASFHSPEVRKTEKIKEPSLREKAVEIKFTDRHTQKSTAYLKPITEAISSSKQKRIVLSLRAKKYLSITVTALPLLVFLLWIPFNLEKLNNLGHKAKSLNYSNLIPFIDKALPVYLEREKIPGPLSGLKNFDPFFDFPDSISVTSISFFEKDEPEYSENKKIIVKLKDFAIEKNLFLNPKSKFLNNESQYRFHIIGGCFQYFENAQKLVDQLRNKGFNAAIVDKHKGLFRVCYQSFTTRNDAVNLLAQVQSPSGNNAWLLVK